MIGSTRALRVWAYGAPADLRKGFDGLAGLVAIPLQQDVLRGDCYLFVNRDRPRAKVLLWDGTGLCLYHTRLEQGRFAALWPPTGSAPRAVRTLTLSTGPRKLGVMNGVLCRCLEGSLDSGEHLLKGL